MIRPIGPETSVTVSSGFCPDFVSLDFHIPMTQIVISLYYEHRFQYVERSYSGFVALSFVVTAHAGLGDLRNQCVKLRKEFRFGMPRRGSSRAFDTAQAGRLIKLDFAHGTHRSQRCRTTLQRPQPAMDLVHRHVLRPIAIADDCCSRRFQSSHFRHRCNGCSSPLCR
jgi:hypothetical protein